MGGNRTNGPWRGTYIITNGAGKYLKHRKSDASFTRYEMTPHMHEAVQFTSKRHADALAKQMGYSVVLVQHDK